MRPLIYQHTFRGTLHAQDTQQRIIECHVPLLRGIVSLGQFTIRPLPLVPISGRTGCQGSHMAHSIYEPAGLQLYTSIRSSLVDQGSPTPWRADMIFMPPFLYQSHGTGKTSAKTLYHATKLAHAFAALLQAAPSRCQQSRSGNRLSIEVSANSSSICQAIACRTQAALTGT